MQLQVTILADNAAGRGPLRGESGLSVMIESPTRNYLFDTGLGRLFYQNARHIGVELYGVDNIILSHGHYDHSNGLPWAFEECPRAHLILHEKALERKYSSSTGKLRYIGINKRTLKLISEADQTGKVSFLKSKPLHFPDAIIFSTGGREHFPSDWNFYLDSPDGPVFDNFEDEISLLINGKDCAMLFVGCSHCQLSEIVKKAATLTDKPIRYILGGSHLNKVTDDEIDFTADFFRKRPECTLFLGHCTGISGFSRLYHALNGINIHPFNSGWQANFNL